MKAKVRAPQRGVSGEARIPVNSHETTAFTRDALKKGMSKWVFQSMPSAMLTVTVQEPHLRRRNDDGRWLVPDSTLLKKTSELLHYVNSAVFGKSYRKRNKGLVGFGVLEYQKNSQPHFHLVITNSMPPKLFKKIKKKLLEKVKKFPLLNESGVDFRMIGGDEGYWRIGGYLAKDGSLLTLGLDGVY